MSIILLGSKDFHSNKLLNLPGHTEKYCLLDWLIIVQLLRDIKTCITPTVNVRIMDNICSSMKLVTCNVFTEPSMNLIFRCLTFDLYSSISWRKKNHCQDNDAHWVLHIMLLKFYIQWIKKLIAIRIICQIIF